MPGERRAARKGIDNRKESIVPRHARKQEEEATKSKGPSLFDPYFDIVEVTVYGQARFFNPPPEMPAAEPSPGETPARRPSRGCRPAARRGRTPADCQGCNARRRRRRRAGVLPEKPATPPAERRGAQGRADAARRPTGGGCHRRRGHAQSGDGRQAGSCPGRRRQARSGHRPSRRPGAQALDPRAPSPDASSA